MTGFVHGESVAEAVAKSSDILFSEVALQADFSPADKKLLLDNVPTTETQIGQMAVDVLVSAGLADSKREARDFIKNGSVRLGSDKLTDIEDTLKEDHFNNGLAVLGRGKKQRVILKLK